MASTGNVTLSIGVDTQAFERKCRIIAGHLEAIANELEDERIKEAMTEVEREP